LQINERIEKYWDTRSEDFSRVRMLEIAGADFLAWNEIIKKHLPTGKKLKVLDVGTGAGFPAIPIKIFKPNIEIFLLDSLNKRVEFLKKVIAELNLENVTCIHGRAEDFAQQKNFRESFDLVTARAVARLNIISEYCLPFVKVGGTFAALKGKQFQDEVAEAENAVKILGGDKIICAEKNLPEISDVRAVIYIDKKKTTTKNFPRKAGTPAKNPLM
jgi:16S rRNA (guanine527-N7)-methyltransferase